MKEPLATIRHAPGLFLGGFVVIALVVIALRILLYENHFGLLIGLSAGFQGAAYLWLYRLCQRRANRKGIGTQSP